MAHPVKCVCVGDGAVGKTSLLLAFTRDSFSEDYIPTVFDNYSANMMVDGKLCNLGLWDTAGQDDYDRLRPLSYPQTDIFVLCYSMISSASLQNCVEKWYPELRHYCPSTPIILVGTKSDLIASAEVKEKLASKGVSPVTLEQAEAVAKKIGAAKHYQVSSYTRDNVRNTFNDIARVGMNPSIYDMSASKKKKSAKKATKCALF